MRTLVRAGWLWDGSSLVPDTVVMIEERRLAAWWRADEREIPSNAQYLEFPDALIAPAYFDVHIHGAAGHDVMEATPDALRCIQNFLASKGTGHYLATTVTAPVETTLRSLEGLARWIENATDSGSAGARPLGVHLEGPFLSHTKRGVHPPELLIEPSVALFDRFFEAAAGHVTLMTLAPELPGAASLAAHATARGVRVSMGHSNANYEQTIAVMAAGACSATHTFNAMRPLDHREPGILGTVLTNDSLYAELICDGIHVHPALVNLWWRAKGASKAILVTDAMSATGMPNGEYLLAGLPVVVSNGRASLKENQEVLAGSVLTLDRALKNFIAYTGERLETALRLVTCNPAAMAGLGTIAGAVRVGEIANLVVVGADGSLKASVVGGVIQNLVSSLS